MKNTGQKQKEKDEIKDDMMLSEQELASVTNRLQIPLIVQDILDDEGILTDEVQLGLHEILSDDQPDSALLCIALSAQKIANRYKAHCVAMKILGMECERIVAEYASIWLKNAQEKSLDDNMVFETLVHIPEDLESLAELLEAGMITLQLENDQSAALCQILIVQARSQSLIAETYLESMDLFDDEAPWEIQQGLDPVIADQEIHCNFTDNVIQFPGGKTKT